MDPFKLVFSADLIEAFVMCISQCDASFDGNGFKNFILPHLESLELKDRSNLIAEGLDQFLPSDPDQRERILIRILHPLGWDNSLIESSNEGISGWGTLPMTTLVGHYGLGDFERSMNALKAMTGHFSSEFSIRFLILEDSAKAVEILASWLNDPDQHVRRLISEGTRPRLPWAMQLPQFIARPEPILTLLKALRDDDAEYVRRSVANNLNDIAKDHPDLVAQLAVDWMNDVYEKRVDAKTAKSRERLVRHASRTLIKQGHPIALSAFGVRPPELSSVRLSVSTNDLVLGESLQFSLFIASGTNKAQKLIIDYVMHFKKANGKTAPKVFKWTNQTLPANGTLLIERRHAIKPITTRKYYAGEQQVGVRINGQDFPECAFQLTL